MANLINSWCSPDGPWRWVTQENAQQPVKIILKEDMPANMVKTPLAKVFTTMRTALNALPREELLSEKTQANLFELREMVEVQYLKYCNSHCIFTRIWEIFLSIFPGRTSTWMEHRRLLRTIDESMGLIDVAGTPLFERNLIPFITPIQEQLFKWKDTFYDKVPCRFIASIVIKEGDKDIYRIRDPHSFIERNTFDGIFNNPTDNPELFFMYVAGCLRQLPKVVSGFPSSGKFTVHMTLIRFTKAAKIRNQEQVHAETEFKRIKVDLPKSLNVLSTGGNMGHYFEISKLRDPTFLKAFGHTARDIKFPDALVDANGNFC